MTLYVWLYGIADVTIALGYNIMENMNSISPCIHEGPRLTDVGIEVFIRVVEPATSIQAGDEKDWANLGLVSSKFQRYLHKILLSL